MLTAFFSLHNAEEQPEKIYTKMSLAILAATGPDLSVYAVTRNGVQHDHMDPATIADPQERVPVRTVPDFMNVLHRSLLLAQADGTLHQEVRDAIIAKYRHMIGEETRENTDRAIEHAKLTRPNGIPQIMQILLDHDSSGILVRLAGRSPSMIDHLAIVDLFVRSWVTKK